jgi:hypothetical protein
LVPAIERYSLDWAGDAVVAAAGVFAPGVLALFRRRASGGADGAFPPGLVAPAPFAVAGAVVVVGVDASGVLAGTKVKALGTETTYPFKSFTVTVIGATPGLCSGSLTTIDVLPLLSLSTTPWELSNDTVIPSVKPEPEIVTVPDACPLSGSIDETINGAGLGQNVIRQ